MFLSTGLEQINYGYVMHHYLRSRCCGFSAMFMLAVSDLLMILGSQTNRIFGKKRKKKVMGGVRFTRSSRPVKSCSSMWAVGDVYSHSETTKKCRSPDVTTTTSTTVQTTMGPTPIAEAAEKTTEESCVLHNQCVSTYSTKLFPSAAMPISCLSNRAKAASSERTNSDANLWGSLFVLLPFP